MTLIEFIDKRNTELGLTRTDLADKGAISWTTLNKIRSGRPIAEITKRKLAAALCCTIGDINAALAQTDQVTPSAEVVKKQKYEQPEPETEPEEACPYDEPVEDTGSRIEQADGEAQQDTLCIVESDDEDDPEWDDEIPEKQDAVNHPAHYTQGGIECIEALKACMSTDEFRGYMKGCLMKYVWRYRLKNGLEDLKKARWYLDRLISEMEVAKDDAC